jgi:hypothetical protein
VPLCDAKRTVVQFRPHERAHAAGGLAPDVDHFEKEKQKMTDTEVLAGATGTAWRSEREGCGVTFTGAQPTEISVSTAGFLRW